MYINELTNKEVIDSLLGSGNGLAPWVIEDLSKKFKVIRNGDHFIVESVSRVGCQIIDQKFVINDFFVKYKGFDPFHNTKEFAEQELRKCLSKKFGDVYKKDLNVQKMQIEENERNLSDKLF